VAVAAPDAVGAEAVDGGIALVPAAVDVPATSVPGAVDPIVLVVAGVPAAPVLEAAGFVVFGVREASWRESHPASASAIATAIGNVRFMIDILFR
jgi:hypothetical protein